MVPCICYFELRFWCCFSCFCLLKTSCLLNYLREFPPPCSLITSCSLNYFERIFPPVRLLHPVLLIDSSEYKTLPVSHGPWPQRPLLELLTRMTLYSQMAVHRWCASIRNILCLNHATFCYCKSQNQVCISSLESMCKPHFGNQDFSQLGAIFILRKE